MARWLTFEAFYEEMGPRPSSKHTLERENNDAGYCPENCIWATRTEQNRNKSTNRRITYQGQTRSLAEWAETLGIHYETLRGRLHRGWSVERTFSEPVHQQS